MCNAKCCIPLCYNVSSRFRLQCCRPPAGRGPAKQPGLLQNFKCFDSKCCLFQNVCLFSDSGCWIIVTFSLTFVFFKTFVFFSDSAARKKIKVKLFPKLLYASSRVVARRRGWVRVVSRRHASSAVVTRRQQVGPRRQLEMPPRGRSLAPPALRLQMQMGLDEILMIIAS